MDKRKKDKRKIIRQTYFVARELQFTIALMVMMALLGGIFLQSISSALTGYMGLETHALGIFLVIGYVALVGLLSIVFSHRLVGPFKRLEYEINYVLDGNLDGRLSVRVKDDLHIRNFIDRINRMISNFEEMDKSYNKLNGNLTIFLNKVGDELAEGTLDKKKALRELREIQHLLDEYRMKWK